MIYVTIQLEVPLALLSEEDQISREAKTITLPRVLFAVPDDKALSTLASLLPPPLIADELIFALPFHATLTRPPPELPNPVSGTKLFFPTLAPDRPLSDVLKGAAWVEFPTIQVIPRAEWAERLDKGKVTIVPLAEPLAQGCTGRIRDSGWGAKRKPSADVPNASAKRPKMEADLALTVLGDYESGEEEDVEVEVENDGKDVADGGEFSQRLEIDVEEEREADELCRQGGGRVDERALHVLETAVAADLGE